MPKLLRLSIKRRAQERVNQLDAKDRTGQAKYVLSAAFSRIENPSIVW